MLSALRVRVVFAALTLVLLPAGPVSTAPWAVAMRQTSSLARPTAPSPPPADTTGGFSGDCNGKSCADTVTGGDTSGGTSGGGGGGGVTSPYMCGLPMKADPVHGWKDGTVIPCTRIREGVETVWNPEKKCYGWPARDLTTADGTVLKMQEKPGEVLKTCAQHWDGSDFYQGPLAASWWERDDMAAVDPAVLARQAVAQMQLRAPQIGMTGGSPPEGMQIVGIPAWLWVADPGESTTGPITRSASDRGITVTATARLDRTVWTMGDGTSVTCSGAKAAGTPYEPRFDKAASPTCGHTYTRTSAGQPNKAFTVIVTAYWVVDWSAGANQSGTITQQMSSNVQKQVGELQALIVSPGGKR